MGDLKENAEYHIAKEDQAHLETKIKRLQSACATRWSSRRTPSADVVAFGDDGRASSTRSRVARAAGRSSGPTEADLAAGRLSAESPVAQALIGAAPGETVTVETPRGARTYRVERLGA